MYHKLPMKSQRIDGNRNSRTGGWRGRGVILLTLAWALAGGTVLAGDAGVNLQAPSATAASGSQMDNADFWVGQNISAVVRVFGQPTYWNANHEGGGGGNRYIYSNPNQPHFVFETKPGEMIVRAVKIP